MESRPNDFTTLILIMGVITLGIAVTVFALISDLWLLVVACIVSLVPVIISMQWWLEDRKNIDQKWKSNEKTHCTCTNIKSKSH